jgi:hypothetical protein
MNTKIEIETPDAPAEASAPITEARVNAWTEKHEITIGESKGYCLQ